MKCGCQQQFDCNGINWLCLISWIGNFSLHNYSDASKPDVFQIQFFCYIMTTAFLSFWVTFWPHAFLKKEQNVPWSINETNQQPFFFFAADILTRYSRRRCTCTDAHADAVAPVPWWLCEAETEFLNVLLKSQKVGFEKARRKINLYFVATLTFYVLRIRSIKQAQASHIHGSMCPVGTAC